jgi:predicted dehydrogenase
MGKVKIAFVGTGSMGQLAHLVNYTAVDDCDVIAVADPRQKLAQKVARRYGVEKVYKDHKELLEKCDMDAVVAIQPFGNHINIVPDILKAKKHVFTEKPLAGSVEAGKKLVEMAKDNDVLYMVGYHKRSDPAMVYARKLIQEWKANKEYGRMRLVRITMPPGDWTGGAGKALTSEEPKPENINRKSERPYNEFINYYIHQINTLRFLFCEPYRLTFADKSGVLLVAESESGVCGTIEMAPYNNSIDWNETILVAFEKGYIQINLPSPLACQQAGHVTVMRDNGKEEPSLLQPTLPKVSAMRLQAENFLAAVRGDRPAPCDAEEALEDLKIAGDYISIYSR